MNFAPIPFEIVGASNRRASEIDRDRAAIELAAYVIGLLKFDQGGMLSAYSDELLKRANKVRKSQGNGEVIFIAETAATIQAAAEPIPAKAAFEATEAALALLMGEPS